MIDGKNNQNLVKFIKKSTCFIEKTVKIGKNVVIFPNNVILGNTVIGDNVVLGCGNVIKNCIIGNDCNVEYSHMEDSKIENDCKIGPFSRLRPNSVIKSGCKIGNFVEIKNSTLGKNTKASHLAYIGDADIGQNCNIGCGAIFVNYNGKQKNRTMVEDDCFIGSNVNIIAPVHMSKCSYICAGTTLTQDTNCEDFVIGRARETVKPCRAKKYLKESK